MTRRPLALAAGLAATAALALAGCATPPGAAPADPGAASTPAACAVAGSPWTLDRDALVGGVTEYLVAQGARISSSSGVGSYEVEFARNGSFILTSGGITVTTVWDTAVGPSTYIDSYTAGTSTASWAETDETGKNIEFSSWSSDIEWQESRDVRIEDGSANGVGYPLWEISYTPDVAVECSADELVLRMADTPQPFDLVFRH